MKCRLPSSSVIALATALFLPAGQSWAQAQAPGETAVEADRKAGEQAAPQQSGIREIVVTAQRREQALQDVPVAITAVGTEFLQERQITSIDRLSSLAPNVLITTGHNNSSSSQISIRGSTTINTNILYDPSVATYLDGVYIGKAYGSIFDINDLERVEVLRGPQGTLFGRNTLAGAVSLVTRKPGPQFRAEAEFTYGAYDDRRARGLINVPLTDNLFIKVAAQLQFRDGYTDFVRDPNGGVPDVFLTNDGADNRNRKSGQVQVRWQPTSDLTFDYAYDISRIREHPLAALDSFGPAGGVTPPGVPLISLFPGLETYLANGRRPKTISTNVGYDERSKVYGHALNVELALGDATVKSITSYRKLKYKWRVNDLDGTPFAIAAGAQDSRYHQFSQELQLSGDLWGDRINYVVGAFYFEDSAKFRNPQDYYFGSVDTRAGSDTRAIAAFGQADWKIGDRLTLTGGLRWTQERKTLTRFFQFTPPGGPPLPVGIEIDKDDDVHATFDNVSPTLIATFAVNDEVNVYGKYAVGFRSGGYNGEISAATAPDPAAAIASATPYEPEYNKSFEIGLKSQLFDRTVQFNVAAFSNKEEDKQVSVFTPGVAAGSVVRNAGKATNKGLEVEIQWVPNDFISLGGSFGRIWRKYKEFCDTPATPQPGASCGGQAGQVNVAENRQFAHSPKITASVNGSATLVETDNGKLSFIADAQYYSSFAGLETAKRYDPRFPSVVVAPIIPSLWLVNAQLRFADYEVGGGKAYASLWARNIFDERKLTNALDFGSTFGYMRIGNYSEPRTYGLTVGYRY